MDYTILRGTEVGKTEAEIVAAFAKAGFEVQIFTNNPYGGKEEGKLLLWIVQQGGVMLGPLDLHRRQPLTSQQEEGKYFFSVRYTRKEWWSRTTPEGNEICRQLWLIFVEELRMFREDNR